MQRAATLAAFLAHLALAPLTYTAPAASADTAKPASPPTRPAAVLPPVSTVKAASSGVLTAAPEAAKAKLVKQAVLQAAPDAAAPGATAPAPKTPAPATAPATPPAATVPGITTQPVPNPTPTPPPDSVAVRQYKMGNRPYSEKDAKQFLAVLNFKPKGKPESTAVGWVYRDERGAMLSFEKGMSEWAYAYDTVAFLDPKEYIADSLIRTVTDGRLKEFLRGKMDQYAFVNYEKTLVQPRSAPGKEGAVQVAPPVPAYYVGRYLRKLGGRYILGENFQVRLGVGRAHAVSFISYRDPLLTDSSMKVMVPTKELVQAYLEKWGKDRSRLGRQYYPYHPDNLRIRALKPLKVFESYVLVQEKFRDNPSKDGMYLTPKVTVLAEVSLIPSRKRLKLPAPTAPVHLHFHFPCTPQAGLCWPDGKQGIQGAAPAQTAPAPTAPAAPATPAAPAPKTN